MLKKTGATVSFFNLLAGDVASESVGAAHAGLYSTLGGRFLPKLLEGQNTLESLVSPSLLLVHVLLVHAYAYGSVAYVSSKLGQQSKQRLAL